MTALNQQLCIGAHTLGGDVLLDHDERRRHLYVIGQTGTGKSRNSSQEPSYKLVKRPDTE